MAEQIWKMEHRPNFAQERACCALTTPPDAISYAAFSLGLFAMLAAIRRAIGLIIGPHAPPKQVYLLGPTAGQGFMALSGSIKENIVLVAVMPNPPPFKQAYAICQVIEEFGDSFTNNGFLHYFLTHLTMFYTTYGTSEQARPIPLSGMPWLHDKFNYTISKLA